MKQSIAGALHMVTIQFEAPEDKVDGLAAWCHKQYGEIENGQKPSDGVNIC